MSKLTSKELRKLAEQVREEGKKAKDLKMIKSAKFIVGLTAIAHLKRKLRSL